MSALAAALAGVLALGAGGWPDVRIAVVAGSNVGLPGEQPLAWAEEDARRVHRLLIDVGGVSEDRAYLLVGATADGLRRALAEAAGRLKELAKEQQPASLILYVSAHADEDALHLQGERLALSELRATLSRLPTRLRLTVVDGCRVAAPGALRGGVPGPEVAVSYDRSVQVSGEVFIAAASRGEGAQEWRFLQGGLFTSHLLTALRGAADADEDGRVTLSEAYAYTYRRTAAQAVSGGASQHPTFDYQLAGWGEWPLSNPGGLGATIVLERDLAGETMIANRDHELVGEIVKSPGERVRVAVSPGWYRVVRPDGAFADVAEINLGFGGERRLDASSFVRTRLSRAVQRGGEAIVLRPWKLGLGYALSAGPLAGIDVEHLGELTLGRVVGHGELRLGLGATRAAFRGDGQEVVQWQVRARLGGGYAWPVSVATVGLGAEAQVSWAHQSIVRDDAESLERVFGLRPEPAMGLIVGAGALGWVELPFTDRASATLEGTVGVQRVPLRSGASWALAADGRLGLQYRF